MVDSREAEALARLERRPWRVAASVATPFVMLLALALPALLRGLQGLGGS